MNNVKSCPNCCQQVDVIAINRDINEHNQTFYFINCESCGFGTKEAYPDKDKLVEKWNELLLEDVNAQPKDSPSFHNDVGRV